MSSAVAFVAVCAATCSLVSEEFSVAPLNGGAVFGKFSA
jgi:hypothetical protein